MARKNFCAVGKLTSEPSVSTRDIGRSQCQTRRFKAGLEQNPLAYLKESFCQSISAWPVKLFLNAANLA